MRQQTDTVRTVKAGRAGTPPAAENRGRGLRTRLGRLDRRFLPVVGTVATLVVMLGVGQARYSTDAASFVSMRLISNLLVDNSYLLVLAVGMTFVILTGGIDLSVGAVVALVGLTVAQLFIAGVPLPVVLAVGVLIGTLCGLLIGVMVQVFDIQPFIASLAVMFLARGLANVVSVQSLAIDDPGFAALASWGLQFGEGSGIWRINSSMLIAAAVLLVAFYLLHYTRFGRTVYGLGSGDDGSAVRLMGLRGERTRILVYVISGTCAGIAGILFAFYTRSGFNLTGIGMELDAIAAVVIGGTLLSGGVGFVLGTGVGVLVYGLIQVLIAREGLDSWWTRVFIGVVLLGFVILQRAISVRRRR
ncbi:ABC transporter permease subunit [Georgenia sp. H159]|uniref:ABC transporter permease subunit n=1 Tax=Georgenia sp. H159 TaxID=3076115 RepID=UPI002D768D0B|nr:sugar ABC transporter permease YjfF [Georgenia sp. H159]